MVIPSNVANYEVFADPTIIVLSCSEIADSILQNSKFLDSSEIEENAIRLVDFCRENKSKRTRLDAFMEEYGLSNNEGIALMCLAESLLRIPDKRTRDDLIKEKIRKIVLVRPAVEAGEKLGFLPGDLSSKIDPYLRPLYDALHDMLGAERVNRLVERDIIEIAPLAYMRGRTLREAFIIMDEGQNTTIEQMKMFLTRLGFGSKAVVNGDLSQIDLPKSTVSGLKHAIEVLKDVESIKFTKFTARDVVRHSLVQEIVEAYDNFE